MDILLANGSMHKSQPSFDSGKLYSFPESMKKGSRRGIRSIGKSLRQGVSKVFSEDEDASEKRILDPRSEFMQRWNKIFLVSCLLALIVDPFFFLLPSISKDNCIQIERSLGIVVTILRTITDSFYLLHMFLRFRTGFVAPSSRVFGAGVLVRNPKLIAKNYLSRAFWLDLIAVLPIPQDCSSGACERNWSSYSLIHTKIRNRLKTSQLEKLVYCRANLRLLRKLKTLAGPMQVVIWIVIPSMSGPTVYHTKNALRFIVLIQYIPRVFLILPLTSEIVKTGGVVMETAWAGAAYNLLLYIIASHFIGALWYLLSIERKDTCWRQHCNSTTVPPCHLEFLYCGQWTNQMTEERNIWITNNSVITECGSSDGDFKFGLYEDAYEKKIVSENFYNKYFSCLWWGLQQLSSLGQNLDTSTYLGEIFFAIFIAILGLVLFAQLIGNMQTYLQSLGVRIEEWRVKQSDMEEWMRHRQLPLELQERVHRYNQYKWVATKGVDEESIFESLPPDLRRDIKRHLCLDLVLQVPLFNQMDERLLDAICERLKPVLCTEGAILLEEGDPVSEMLFIIRGDLDSVTTNGGMTGFFNSIRLSRGHFCGEELLTWALDPKPTMHLPSSTRAVRALTEVEAFALRAEDLRYVAGQFRRLHSKKLQHTFRFYSHQWRTWSACFIQSAWRRYKNRKKLMSSASFVEDYDTHEESAAASSEDFTPSIGATVLASRFAKNALRGVHRLRAVDGSDSLPKVPKPLEPDFMDENTSRHE